MSFHDLHLRRFCIAACLLVLASPLLAEVRQVPEGDIAMRRAPAAEVADRIVVGYRNRSAPGDRTTEAAGTVTAEWMQARLGAVHGRLLARGVRAKLLRHTGVGSQVLKLDAALTAPELQRIADDLKASDPDIEYVEPVRRRQIALVPNDPQFGQQWSLTEAAGGISAPAAWDRTSGVGTVIAVVDTGMRRHADLADQLLAGYDMIIDTNSARDGNGRDEDPLDPGDFVAARECDEDNPARASSWHGIHVAGIAAARALNRVGVAGVAFLARILPVRVLGKCGGFDTDIADGIVWAAGGAVPGARANSTPARVINLSLGGHGECSATLQRAVDIARARGAVVVAAAGNDDDDVAKFAPANCRGVITVAATNRDGARAFYSNRGANVALAAPGGDMRARASDGILSTIDTGVTKPAGDGYGYKMGTSMAAPHVSGVIALMLNAKPNATPDQIKAALQASARPFPGDCEGCGAGIVDAPDAIAAIKGEFLTLFDAEPNNSLSTATIIPQPANVAGSISSTTDRDFFKVPLPAGKTLTAMLTADSAANDFNLYVRDGAGTSLTNSTKGAGLADVTQFTNRTGTTTWVLVEVARYKGTGSYLLKLRW